MPVYKLNDIIYVKSLNLPAAAQHRLLSFAHLPSDLETAQFRGGNFCHSNYYHHDIGRHHQLCLSGMAARSVSHISQPQDPKDRQFKETFMVCAHSTFSRTTQVSWTFLLFIYQNLFLPGLPQQPTTPAYYPSPVWPPLLVLLCPSRLSICQSTLPSKPSRRCFSTQGK